MRKRRILCRPFVKFHEERLPTKIANKGSFRGIKAFTYREILRYFTSDLFHFTSNKGKLCTLTYRMDNSFRLYDGVNRLRQVTIRVRIASMETNQYLRTCGNDKDRLSPNRAVSNVISRSSNSIFTTIRNISNFNDASADRITISLMDRRRTI